MTAISLTAAQHMTEFRKIPSYAVLLRIDIKSVYCGCSTRF